MMAPNLYCIDRADERLDDLEATPAALADWLADECADDDSALSVWRLEQRARRGDALSMPELLVLAMNSQDSGLVMSCLHRLRGKFRDAREPAVLARVVDEVLGVAQ